MRHRSRQDLPLIAIILAAFALRVWNLGDKALSYDEAATAIMSRAAAPDIIAFHWTAAFEHLPLWVLGMRAWSLLVGQSEFALRLPSALAGVLAAPLLWAMLKRAAPHPDSWKLLAATLVTTSPALVLYSQEARMYTLVVAFALISTYVWLRLCQRPSANMIAAYVLASWVMMGLQYYSVLLVGAHLLSALYVTAVTRRDAQRASFWRAAVSAAALATMPLLVWMALSPGFQETLHVVLREAQTHRLTFSAFLLDIWRDLSFGAFRWQPKIAWLGFLTAPLFLLGVIAACVDARQHGWRAALCAWHPLFIAIVALPVILSAALLRTLAARYILYVVPFIYAFIAYAILALRRLPRLAALSAASIILAVALAGLAYYYGPYHKSEYREMARYLLDRYDPAQDAILIEAPRQHLLAKYYMGQDFPLQPVPDIPLPDYWPVTAPTVVPEAVDNLVQERLRTHAHIWLIQSAENEVDAGEFLPKYLAAVAYNQDCRTWLDVRLCRYISPDAISPELDAPSAVTFGGELELEYMRASTDARHAIQGVDRSIFVELGWYAQKKPSLDYAVSLRLVAPDRTVAAQSDQYPIGMLLPPTAWSAGNRKPGYTSLAIPDSTPHGIYTLEISVYDPATLSPAPYSDGGAEVATPAPIILGLVEINGTIRLLPAGAAVMP